MNPVSTTARKRRLSSFRLILLGVLVLGAFSGFLALMLIRARDDRAMFLREAQQRLKANQKDLALSYLNRYLELNPDDTNALDLKAKILAESVQNAYQALEAIQLHNRVLGRDPDDPRRQETRRRLVELTLKVGGRSQAAVALARDLIKRGVDAAAAHRLLAQALEEVGAEGDARALAEACREYEAAERKEPGDVDSAERLALLYRDKRNDPGKALRVLDDLVRANVGEPERLAQAHLVRSRFFAGLNQPDKVATEIAEGLRADPANVAVRLAAAEDATERGDMEAARRHLAGIPPAARDLRIKLIEGLIELKEQHPDEAVRDWRSGLLQTGGNNADLTWRLAHVLIDTDRPREAEPLLSQYRRLVGGDEPDAWYRYLNGFLLLKKGRPAEAITELETIRYKVPKALEPHLYDLLGRSYEAIQDRLKAIDAYRQATTLSRRWSDPWLAIARVQAAEDLDEAITTMDQALAALPDDARLLANLALLSWQRQLERPPAQRSWTEVERALERARKAAPGAVELALFEADYLVTLGRLDDGLARLEAASKLNPKSVPLWSARANGLKRLGRTTQALEVLAQASAATGEQAAYALIRSAILVARDHVKEARATLTEGLGRVPDDRQPTLWKALGDLAIGQGDLIAARHAFTEWARLQPDNPEPRMALFDLALTSGDQAAIHAEVEAMKDIGGPKAPYWRLARVEELLRARPDPTAEPSREASRLDEADRLIREIKTDHPLLPVGYLLEGRLAEKRHQTDKAVAAYEQALRLKGGEVVLDPLVALLVRERRDADLDQLRKTTATIPAELERLATVQALKIGDKEARRDPGREDGPGRSAGPRRAGLAGPRPERARQARGGREDAPAPDRSAARRAGALAPAPDAPGRPEAGPTRRQRPSSRSARRSRPTAPSCSGRSATAPRRLPAGRCLLSRRRCGAGPRTSR